MGVFLLGMVMIQMVEGVVAGVRKGVEGGGEERPCIIYRAVGHHRWYGISSCDPAPPMISTRPEGQTELEKAA